ncbi:MAG: hypothetical protein MAG715_00776 [Methanonatronarchaeales archaeon]|nr:hypothetical protein [Methanonatronarchaeales archaeon]
MSGCDPEELREEAIEWINDVAVDCEQWFFLRVEVEAPHLDLARLPDSIPPRLGLRTLDSGRYAVEGHAELLEIPDLLEGAASELSGLVGTDCIVSIIVETHDYELLDAPVLYLEGR